MHLFPVPGMGEYDEIDYFGAFTAKEATKLGVAQLESSGASLEGVEPIEPLQMQEKGPKTDYVMADGAY
jgi:NCS1 family nucleobase:cation symporter-1